MERIYQSQLVDYGNKEAIRASCSQSYKKTDNEYEGAGEPSNARLASVASGVLPFFLFLPPGFEPGYDLFLKSLVTRDIEVFALKRIG